MRKDTLLFLALVGLTVLLSSCSSGVSKPAPEERTPTELLIGSWYATETEVDVNGNTKINKIVLTLTPDRYIYHVVEYTSDGEIEQDESVWRSGEWHADETTISTTTVLWDRDEERYGDPQSAEKDYYFSDDKEALYVHRWLRDEARHYERFSAHPGLGDISGTYKFVDDFTADDYDWHVERTFEITNDSFVEMLASERDGEPWVTWRLAGDLRYDRSNYYMFVSVTDVEHTIGGVPNKRLHREHFVGHILRLAYAPTAEPDSIALSLRTNEQSFDPDSNTWSDREDNPYGNYWVFAKRQ